jgi:hypothetical protein
MPGARCPAAVLEAMVRANPLAVVTEDYHQYGGTPLHFCCGSRLRDDPHMVRLLVETALDVQAHYDPHHLTPPRLSYWSPFYQAAKWAAPPATLWVLCQARRQQAWIAPWTGAENYGQAAEIAQTSLEPARDSPLRALWRRTTPKRLISLHGLALAELRRMATRMLTLPEDEVWDYLLQKSDQDNNNDDEAEASFQVQQHWLKLLVLLRHQVNGKDTTLLHTVVTLLVAVPALVTLVGVVFAEQHLEPHRTNGRLPLHAALARYQCSRTAPVVSGGTNDEVVQILVQAQPQALFVMDPLTGRLPLVQAAAAGASVDVLYAILRSAPAVVPTTHFYSKYHHQAWLTAPRRPWEYVPDQE